MQRKFQANLAVDFSSPPRYHTKATFDFCSSLDLMNAFSLEICLPRPGTTSLWRPLHSRNPWLRIEKSEASWWKWQSMIKTWPYWSWATTHLPAPPTSRKRTVHQSTSRRSCCSRWWAWGPKYKPWRTRAPLTVTAGRLNLIWFLQNLLSLLMGLWHYFMKTGTVQELCSAFKSKQILFTLFFLQQESQPQPSPTEDLGLPLMPQKKRLRSGLKPAFPMKRVGDPTAEREQWFRCSSGIHLFSCLFLLQISLFSRQFSKTFWSGAQILYTTY